MQARRRCHAQQGLRSSVAKKSKACFIASLLACEASMQEAKQAGGDEAIKQKQGKQAGGVAPNCIPKVAKRAAKKQAQQIRQILKKAYCFI
jgi:hypothetical protein